MFIAGDIGGTKVRLALCEKGKDGEMVLSDVERFVSKDYATFNEILKVYCDSHLSSKIESIAIGVSGPVTDGAVKATNLPWQLSETEIHKMFGVKKVKLVNDLVATAAGVCQLKGDSLEVLHPGNSPKQDATLKGVVAPGTGLGQAFIHTVNGKDIILPSEGSHVDFGPTNHLEDMLLAYMRRQLQKRVSVERFVSGPGIQSIYHFFKDEIGFRPAAGIEEQFESKDPSSVISTASVEGKCELCRKTMETFVSFLGNHCGNVVLMSMCLGGLYLGGGIPPKILSILKEDHFLKMYLSKGRLSSLVEATPVYVVKDDFTALKGAGYIASEL